MEVTKVAGVGKSQQWITCLEPEYLLNKNWREEQVIEDDRSVLKPVQTKWATGFTVLILKMLSIKTAVSIDQSPDVRDEATNCYFLCPEAHTRSLGLQVI